MKFTSLEEFRKFYFPEDRKKREALKEQGTCPECEGIGSTDNEEWRINERTKTKQT